MPDVPPLPPELAGWRWAAVAGGDTALSHPDGLYTTKGYAQPQRAITAAQRWLREQPAPQPPAPPVDTSAALVSLSRIKDNPFQPRLSYDDERIAAIAASIAEHGLLQAPVARPAGEDVELAFGHSRFRAYQLLAQQDPERWGAMPVTLRVLDDETMALHAWIENKDRKDLTSYEEAKAIERYTTTFGWTQAKAAEKLQLDRSTVANKLRLLRLPQQTLTQLNAGELSERQAMALLPLMDLPVQAIERTLHGIYIDGRGYVRTAAELIANAATLDSARLRQGVEKILGELAPIISKELWYSHDWRGVEGVVATLCKGCPLLLSGGRCADIACQGRKAAARQQQQAANAAAAVGLPAKAASSHSGYDDLSGLTLTAIKKQATATGCGNLGVIWLKQNWFPHKVEGHPNCGIVCAHGEGKRCACRAAVSRSANAGDSEAAKKKHDKRQIKEVYKEPAERALAAALAPLSTGLARLLLKQIGYSAESKLDPNATTAQVCQALAVAIVKERIKYHYDYGVDLDKARTELTKLLQGADITPPWLDDAEPAPPPLPLEPTADDLAAVVRRHLAQARELAGVGMARYCLGEAELAIGRVASHNLDMAVALEAELHQVADLLDAKEAELGTAPAAEDVGAQTSAHSARMPPASYAQWLSYAEEVRAHLASGAATPADAATLEWLGGELETLADDERITDGEYEAADEILAQLAEQLDALEVAQ